MHTSQKLFLFVEERAELISNCYLTALPVRFNGFLSPVVKFRNAKPRRQQYNVQYKDIFLTKTSSEVVYYKHWPNSSVDSFSV